MCMCVVDVYLLFLVDFLLPKTKTICKIILSMRLYSYRLFAAVVILCFLLTVSTAFEYKLNQELEYTHRTTGKPCTLPNSTTIPNQMSTVLSANRTSVTESNALATTASANATIEQAIRRLIPAAIVSVRNDSQGQNAHDWTNTTHNLNISSGDNQTDDGQCEWV